MVHIQNVIQVAQLLHVPAKWVTLAIHHNVVQNVSLLMTVQMTKLVSMKDAKIPAQEHAAGMPIVKWSIILQFVHAYLVMREMLSTDVQESLCV